MICLKHVQLNKKLYIQLRVKVVQYYHCETSEFRKKKCTNGTLNIMLAFIKKTFCLKTSEVFKFSCSK